MTIELPATHITASSGCPDPLGLMSGGLRPPDGQQPMMMSPLPRLLKARRAGYCGPDWLSTFREAVKNDPGMGTLTEMRILAYADLLCTSGRSLTAAYDKACTVAFPYLKHPYGTLPYPAANRTLSGSGLTALHALTHAIFGNGEAMSFPIERTGISVDLCNKKSFMDAVRDAPFGSSRIDQRFSHDTFENAFTTGATLGHVTLRLQGDLHKAESGGWILNDGTLRAFNDVYDADRSNHRGGVAEVGTALLQTLIQRPFPILIPGELSVTASGVVH